MTSFKVNIFDKGEEHPYVKCASRIYIWSCFCLPFYYLPIILLCWLQCCFSNMMGWTYVRSSGKREYLKTAAVFIQFGTHWLQKRDCDCIYPGLSHLQLSSARSAFKASADAGCSVFPHHTDRIPEHLPSALGATAMGKTAPDHLSLRIYRRDLNHPLLNTRLESDIVTSISMMLLLWKFINKITRFKCLLIRRFVLF